MKRAAQYAVLVLLGVCAVRGVGQEVAADETMVFSTPMELLHDKPYVSVMLNGKGPFRFLVDTGTSGDAVVSPALATELNLPQVGATDLNDPTGQGAKATPIRGIDTLSVAGLEFYSVKAIEHDLPTVGPVCDGLLGFHLFREYLLTLDYPERRLVVADGELQPDGGQMVHSFETPEGIPITQLRIGDLTVKALLDSGGMGLSLPDAMVSELHFASPPVLFGRAVSLSTQFVIRAGRLADNVRFGDITFEQPWVEVHPAYPLVNFGAVPMHHFKVTFDQTNKLVRLDGPNKRVPLEIAPMPLRLLNAPPERPVEAGLVPVG